MTKDLGRKEKCDTKDSDNWTGDKDCAAAIFLNIPDAIDIPVFISCFNFIS